MTLTKIDIPGVGPYVFGRTRSPAPSLPMLGTSPSAGPKVFADVNSIREAAKKYPVFKGIGNVLGNDRWGVCAIVAPLKMQILFDAAAGREPRIPTLHDVFWAYKQINPDFSPFTGVGDNGCDLESVLDLWMKHGLYQDGYGKIKSSFLVNAANQQEVEEAQDKYGPLYVGCDLPAIWPKIVKPGFTWDVAGDPDPTLGHATFWYGRNANGIFDSTWAMEGTITNAAVKKYFVLPSGEVYAVVPA